MKSKFEKSQSERTKSERAVAYDLSKLYYLPPQGDRNKRKTQCPACMAQNPAWRAKCFTQFVSVSTGEPLDPMVGYCDYASCVLNRANSPVTPFLFFLSHSVDAERMREMLQEYVSAPRVVREPVLLPPLRIDWMEDVLPTLSRDLSNVKVNTLFLGLFRAFRDRFPILSPMLVWNVAAEEMYDTFLVGTYEDRASQPNLCCAPIFWEIDQHSEVREGKIMQYDARTAHRMKGASTINWMTAASEEAREKYSREKYAREHCLFGLHQLASPQGAKVKRVWVVESQKTAIAMRIYGRLRIYAHSAALAATGAMSRTEAADEALRKYGEAPCFMATGGCSMLTRSMLEPLKGLEVVLVPDSGKATEHWRDVAEHAEGMNIRVEDVMERRRIEGLCGENADIADLVLG